MKRIFIALIALMSFTQAFSQAGNDTTKYTFYRFLYGNRTARLWADTVLMIPKDTIWSKDGLALKGDVLYVGNHVKWSQVTGGSGSADSAIFYTVYRSDTSRLNLYAALAGKQPQLNGTGFVKASGTTISYDNSTYQVTSQKDANNGYAGLNSSGLVPIAHLATGTPDGTKFVRDDGTLAVPPGGGGDLADSMKRVYSYVDMQKQIISPIDTNKAANDAPSFVTLPNGITMYTYIVLGADPADRSRSDLWFGVYDGRKFIDSGKFFTTGSFKDSSTTNPHMYIWPNKDTIGLVFTVYTTALDVRTYVTKRPSSLVTGWSTPRVIMDTHNTGWISSYCNNIIQASDGNFYYSYDTLLNAFPSSANGWYEGRMLKTSGAPDNWVHTSVAITTPDTLVAEPFIYEIAQNILDRHGYANKIVYGHRNRAGKILARETTDFGATFSSQYTIAGIAVPNSSVYAMSANRLVLIGYNRKFNNPTDQNETRKELIVQVSADGGFTYGPEIVIAGTESDTIANHEPVIYYTGKYWIVAWSDIQKVSQKSALHAVVLTDEFINSQTLQVQPKFSNLSIIGGAPFTNSTGKRWLDIHNPTLGYDYAHIAYISSSSDNRFAFNPYIHWKADPNFETGMRHIILHGSDVDNNQPYDGAFSIQAFASDGASPLTNAPIAQIANATSIKWKIQPTGTHDFYSSSYEKAVFHATSNSVSNQVTFADASLYKWYVGHYGPSVGVFDGQFRIGNDDGISAWSALRNGDNIIRGDRISGGTGAGYSLNVYRDASRLKGIYTDGNSRFDGNLGFGAVADASALVDMNSTTKGLLIPRMTTTDRDAISSPATSLLIYNTTVDSFQYRTSGSTWQNLGAGGSSLSLAAVGSSPNANGASYSSGTLNLQPADGSNPGVVTAGTQTIGGTKTFSSSPLVPTASAADSSTKAASTAYVDRAIANFSGSLEQNFVKEITTTDATPVNVDTIPIAPGEKIRVECVWDGTLDNGHAGGGAKKARSFYMNDGGTLTNFTLNSMEPEDYKPIASGLSTASFTITNTGNLAIIQFTGEASTTILSKFTYTVTRKGAPL